MAAEMAPLDMRNGNDLSKSFSSVNTSFTTTAPNGPTVLPPHRCNTYPDPGKDLGIIEHPRKGRAVIAFRPFPRGSLILSEHAVCTVNHAVTDTDSSAFPFLSNLSKTMYNLARSQVDMLLSRFRPARGSSATLENIFQNSCFDVHPAHYDGERLKAKSAVFPNLSLVNHDCAPNAMFAGMWGQDAAGCVGMLYARRDIAVGEEVTLCYLGKDEWGDANKRRINLFLRWRFVCECGVCGPFASETAKKRANAVPGRRPLHGVRVH